MAGTNVGQVELDLLLNSQSFSDQLDRAVNKAVSKTSSSMGGKVTSAFGKMGKLAVAAFSVKSIAGFVKATTEAGSALQEVQNVTNVTFKKMNKQMDEFARGAIKKYGMSELASKKYAGTMGAMAQSFGFTEKQAYDMSTTLTGLTGDVASFYNLDHDTAYNKLKAVFTGETEGLKDLGVVMTQTALDEYAMQKGYGKTTAKMSEQEKVALRYAFVLDKLQTASGDFIRTQDGWANQTRILSLQWETFKSNIGQGFIAVLTPLLQVLNAVMDKLVQVSYAFKDFVENITGTKSEDGGGMAGIANDAMNATEGISKATDAAKKMKKSLLSIDEIHTLPGKEEAPGASQGSSAKGPALNLPDMDKAATSASSKLEKIAKMFKKPLEVIKLFGSEAMDYLSIIGKGVGTLGVNIGTDLFNYYTKPFIDNKELISETLTNLLGDWKVVQDTYQVMLDDFFTMINGLYEQHISPLIKSVTEGVSDLFGFVLEQWDEYVQPVIDNIVREMLPVYETYIKPVLEKLMKVLGKVIDLITALWENILQPFLKFCVSVFMPAISAVIAVIWEVVKKAIEKIFGIIDSFLNVLDGVIDFLTGVFTGDWDLAFEGLSKIFDGFVGGIYNMFKEAIDWIGGAFLDAVDWIKEKWTTISDWVVEKATYIKDMVHDAFVGMKDGIANTFESIVDVIRTPVNAVIGLINSMIEGLNKIDIDIPGWVPNYGGKSVGFNIPKIPYLAQGGYIGPNQPRLAMVGDNRHEGEIVAPESKLAAAAAQANAPVLQALQTLIALMSAQQVSGKGDIVVPVYIGGEKLDEFVINANNRDIINRGGY